MRGKVRWSHVTIALALIAALAIAAPAIGGSSLKQLVKKEVAKQIAKATGPAGPPGGNGLNGTNGTNGTNGLDGTARAYGRVSSTCAGAPAVCPVTRSKGVASATRIAGFTGAYCIDAPGINPFNTAAVVSVDWDGTSGPEGNASAMVVAAGTFSGLCDGFIVQTERHGATTDAVPANDVSFTIVIP